MDEWIHFPLTLGNGWSPHGYKPEDANSLELLMSGVPLETS